jgi:hypothetical protein
MKRVEILGVSHPRPYGVISVANPMSWLFHFLFTLTYVGCNDICPGCDGDVSIIGVAWMSGRDVVC